MRILQLFSPTGTMPSLRHREATPGVPSTTDPIAGENQSNIKGGSYQANIAYPSSPQAALTISGVYRAVELRAKTEAQFQMQYQKKMPSGEGGNFAPDLYGRGRRLNYLLQVEPNPLMSAASLFEQITIQRLMLGNAVVYIERDDFGEVKAFWPTETASYNAINGTYNITYTGEHGAIKYMSVPRTDVLHFLNTFRYPNGLWGISTIRYAIDTLSLVKTESRQAIESAAKGGRVKLLIGEQRQGNQGLLAGGLYSKPETKKYAQEINDEIYSQDVVSLRGLDKAQSISMTAQDMQMVELLGMGMDDVARFFGTPRPLLMLDSNSHYTTPTNATLEFMTRTVQPDILEIEQEFQRKVLGMKDFGSHRFHLCEQPLLRLDKEAQAKVDEINLRTGAASVNEIRQQYDRPAVEGGDTIYLLTNLAELGSEKLRSASGSTTPTPTNDDEKGGQK